MAALRSSLGIFRVDLAFKVAFMDSFVSRMCGEYTLTTGTRQQKTGRATRFILVRSGAASLSIPLVPTLRVGASAEPSLPPLARGGWGGRVAMSHSSQGTTYYPAQIPHVSPLKPSSIPYSDFRHFSQFCTKTSILRATRGGFRRFTRKAGRRL